MSQSVLSATVDRVRRAARAEPGDAELVARFGAGGDPDAFAQLVRRHGPMVLAVCRRVTRHRHDAEDAFQAAFLVLARKAGTVSPPGAVAGWLFGVAVNAAREARKRAARRHARESLVPAPPDAGRCEPEPDFDTRTAVAEELAALPERYRWLVVACDLRGEPQAAVARQLGVPVGTVYSRLSTARRLLADRLRRRGVGASAATGFAALAPAAAALPPVSECPSPVVMELTEAIMKRGSTLRWKLAAGALLAGVAIGLGGETPKPAPAPAVAPAPHAADESRLVLGFGGHVRFLKPDGTEASRVTGAEVVKAGADMHTRTLTVGLSSNAGLTATVSETFAPCGRAAPDGRLPLDTHKGLFLLAPGSPPTVAPVKAAKGGDALFAGGEVPYIVAWSPDSKRAVGRRFKRSFLSAPGYEHVLIDLAAGTTAELKVPKNHHVVDWSPDGAWFLTIRQDYSLGFGEWVNRARVLCKVTADGKKSDALTADGADATRPLEQIDNAALSPDGKRVAYQQWTTTAVGEGKQAVHYSGFKAVVLDLARGTRTVVASEPGGEVANEKWQMNLAFGVRWSPDGSRVAFLYEHRDLGEAFAVGLRVGVVGADGGEPKTVFDSAASDPKAPPSLTLFDWR